jgi:hypothetical protein
VPGRARTCRAGGVLVAGESVDTTFVAIAVDESSLVGQSFLDRVDRREHPRMVGGEEPDYGHHEVEASRSVAQKYWVNAGHSAI